MDKKLYQGLFWIVSHFCASFREFGEFIPALICDYLIPNIMKAFKKLTNKEYGFSMWRTSYYDHIIRDENDYLAKWNYIDTNPARWTEDL